MMNDLPVPPDIYEVARRDCAKHSPLPSETRDFAPTLVGWLGIFMATGVLAWLVWRAAGDGGDISTLVLSAIAGYVGALMGWTAIRWQRDEREDRQQERDRPGKS